jgi:hypothetical protein
MHSAFVSSHMRANAGKKTFQKTKQSALTLQASWHGLQERRKMDPAQWEQCHNAVLTLRSVFEKYMGQKQRRKGSFEREKLADYGSLHGTGELFAENANVKAAMAKNNQQKVLFAAGVIKVNINKIKQERVLLVTEGMLFNMDNKCSAKRGVNVKTITAIKMSTMPDNFVNISVEGEQDLCIVCAQKIELVSVLKDRYQALTQQKLNIYMADEFEVTQAKSLMQRKDRFTLKFVKGVVGKDTSTTYAKDKAEPGIIRVNVFDDSTYARKEMEMNKKNGGGADRRLSAMVNAHAQ